ARLSRIASTRSSAATGRLLPIAASGCVGGPVPSDDARRCVEAPHPERRCDRFDASCRAHHVDAGPRGQRTRPNICISSQVGALEGLAYGLTGERSATLEIPGPGIRERRVTLHDAEVADSA